MALSRLIVTSAAVIEPSFAVRNRILPMSFEEECLIVAAAYPVSPDVLDEVENPVRHGGQGSAGAGEGTEAGA